LPVTAARSFGVVVIAADVLLLCRPHQGLILDASPLEWEFMDMLPSLEELSQQQQQQQQDGSSGDAEQQQQPAVKFPVWLALDEVVDPVSVKFTVLCSGWRELHYIYVVLALSPLRCNAYCSTAAAVPAT
jgi:hypothetical protein